MQAIIQIFVTASHEVSYHVALDRGKRIDSPGSIENGLEKFLRRIPFFKVKVKRMCLRR